MTSRHWILPKAENRERFEAESQAAGFADIESCSIYGAFGRRYYPAVFGADLEDHSFLVMGRDGAELLVYCNLLNGQIDRYGFPIRFTACEGAGSVGLSAYRAGLEHLLDLAQRNGAEAVSIESDDRGGCLSALGEVCLDFGGLPSVRLTAQCDLSGGEDGIRQSLRRRYRTLVNRGRDRMDTRVVSRDTPDRAVFEDYRALHREVAGKVTRADETWNLMYEAIAAGRGQLVLCVIEDRPVAGNVVIDGRDTAVYFSAAYDHERIDGPLGHWPVYLAIRDSHARGMARFDLGEVPPRPTATTRQFNVGHFKKGFASGLAHRMMWTLKPA